ncbi:hypothetical protein GF352_01030 [archaeon]|nr:hypothetical protein [archaeon]
MGVHGLFIYGPDGSCLACNDSEAGPDPDLFSGMSCAIHDLGKEVVNGAPQRVYLDNDMGVRYGFITLGLVDKFKIEFSKSLRGADFIEINNDYELFDSLSDYKQWERNYQKISLNDLLMGKVASCESFEKKFENHSIKVKYEEDYEVSAAGSVIIHYVMLYDVVDEQIEFLDGDSFVNVMFNRLGSMLERNAKLLGRASSTGEVNGLTNFGYSLNNFVKRYEELREHLVQKNLFKVGFNPPNPNNIGGLDKALAALPREVLKTISLWYGKFCADSEVDYETVFQQVSDFLKSMMGNKVDREARLKQELGIMREAVEVIDKELSFPKPKGSFEIKKALSRLNKALKKGV